MTVRAAGSVGRSLNVVERVLRSSAGGHSGTRNDRVVVVPGGHRPGRPDHLQRDQARARLPLPGPARIVVLGSSAGAGQTVTTLLAGQLLSVLRDEPVAVIDLGTGPASLTELARQIPRLLPGAAGAGRLHVVSAGADLGAEGAADVGAVIDAVVGRYPLTLADPAAVHVPRALRAADQLVLVTPASADAARSLAMTLEWLEAHGHADIASHAVTVLNGVSEQTARHAERAAAVASGRCRAILRIPWDARLAGGGALGPAAVQAYTALAGVLVAGLADRPADPATMASQVLAEPLRSDPVTAVGRSR